MLSSVWLFVVVTTFYTLGGTLSPFIFSPVALRIITCPAPLREGGRKCDAGAFQGGVSPGRLANG